MIYPFWRRVRGSAVLSVPFVRFRSLASLPLSQNEHLKQIVPQ
jgi:hypothetical protein